MRGASNGRRPAPYLPSSGETLSGAPSLPWLISRGSARHRDFRPCDRAGFEWILSGMTTADTPGDLELGDAVAAEPAWTPSVNAADTGVAVVDGAVTLILPESATGPPSRAPAAARPNVTICVESVCAAFRRPDGVSRSGGWVPRNQDAVRAAGPFHGTNADGYLILASAPSFIAETVCVEHPTAPPNDGLNRVRFPAPVPVAGHPRGTVSPHSAEQRPGGVQAVFGLVCEVPLSDRPARPGQLAVLSR